MNKMVWAVMMIAVAGAAAGAPPANDNSDTYKAFDTLSDAIAKMKGNYVRPVSTQELIDKAIAGAAAALDPHSRYLTKAEFDTMVENTTGPVGGIGLEFTIRGGLLTITAPIDGSPAASAGLRSGDVVMEIDGLSTTGQQLYEIVRILRGPIGSSVTVKIARPGADTPIAMTLTRAPIQINSVRFRLEGAYGYIRLSALNQDTDRELNRAVKHLGTVKGYILDLRNNAGGLLDVAAEVSDEFLDKGTILSLKGRTPQDNRIFKAHDGDLAKGKPIVVLVNEGTASGAEVVAGALQDNHRATVIGMPTFGMGSVQTIIPVTGGGALRLTTALMALPSGRLIQESGITPDKTVSDLPRSATRNDGLLPKETKLPGHFTGDTKAVDSKAVLYPAAETGGDFQLTTALAVLGAKAP